MVDINQDVPSGHGGLRSIRYELEAEVEDGLEVAEEIAHQSHGGTGSSVRVILPVEIRDIGEQCSAWQTAQTYLALRAFLRR